MPLPTLQGLFLISVLACAFAPVRHAAPQQVVRAPGPIPIAIPVEPPAGLAAIDVPLARLVGMGDIGNTYGVAFLDYDGDGWIDLYVNSNARLWRNELGLRFTQVADLDSYLPHIPAGISRYGAAAGDYDNDGFPDIACEPRGTCLYLLRNLGGTGAFLEVGTDPDLLLDPPSCGMFAETFCWIDVDEDGDLDLWATAYPDSIQAGSGGNQFFENLGPSGPGGAYRLQRRTEASGLGQPSVNVSRPEGAVTFDVDRDGDPDTYANGTLYQNVTTTDGPRFVPLVRTPTGISLPNRLDEGVSTFDYDLDGDEDMVVVYKGTGNVLWENKGDGTFFNADGVLDSPMDGATEGSSAEDWDLDGDLDLTTGHIFRRNTLVETGARFLKIARHSIPENHVSFFLTPAWGDWDKDGDPDCMLANWGGKGRFYRNTTYEPATPRSQKLTLRVRAVRDSATVARGLETEFGATAEVRVAGEARGFVRRRTVASSHGYLQQSDYALTFALPAGPDPTEPARGVRFDLLVDFPSLPMNGLLRIDRAVNPVLGELALADLEASEIIVFRSGRVQLGGVEYPPNPRWSARLASSGALQLPAPGPAMPAPFPAPAPDWLVGMEFDTLAAARGLRVQELVLDGQLALAGPARCDANVRVFDVTPDAGTGPRLVQQESLATGPRNVRSFLAVDWTLRPGRVYRVVCRVTELRDSPRVSSAAGALTNRGGLSFQAANACDTAEVELALPDPERNYLELRYRVASGEARRRKH